MNKSIFLDRDGVIIKNLSEGEYITSENEIEILPRVEHAIQTFNQKGYKVYVATNQRIVSKGGLSLERLEGIHNYLRGVLEEKGAHIDGFYVCPHEENACECRKPKPGLLLKAALECNLDLKNSWMIGDKEKDVLAGRAAGCKTVFIGSLSSPEGIQADYTAKDLYEAAVFVTEGRYPRVTFL